MAKDAAPVRTEEVDFQAVMPWLCLFRSFRMALVPGRLCVALALITLLFAVGWVIDLAGGEPTWPGEIRAVEAMHRADKPIDEALDTWRDVARAQALDELRALLAGLPRGRDVGPPAIDAERPFAGAADTVHAAYATAYQSTQTRREQLAYEDVDYDAELAALTARRAADLAAIETIRPRGAFDAWLSFELAAFDRLVAHLLTWNVGWNALIAGDDDALRGSAIGAARDMIVTGPCWLWHAHPWKLAALVFGAIVLVSLFGGALARMAAVHATRGDLISVKAAVRYGRQWWLSYLFTPVVSIAVIAGLALIMALAGFVLFNPPEWAIDIVGGIFFIVFVMFGVAVGLSALLLATGGHLVYPAVAVDGAEHFDAAAHAFNYVLNRFFHWLFYNAVAIVLGALGYLLLAFLLFVVLWTVHAAVGAFVFVETDWGVNRFDMIFPEPRFGQLAYDVDYAGLDWSGRIAAFFVRLWAFLVIALLPAYCVSYYFTANTWIYLLLRRSVSDAAMDDVFIDPDEPATEQPPSPPAASPTVEQTPEKVEA